MTLEEKARKEVAHFLIKLPKSERPPTVKYIPVKPFQLAGYQVVFGGTTVHFQYDSERLYYLGEYPTVQKTMSEQELNEVLRGIN